MWEGQNVFANRKQFVAQETHPTASGIGKLDAINFNDHRCKKIEERDGTSGFPRFFCSFLHRRQLGQQLDNSLQVNF